MSQPDRAEASAAGRTPDASRPRLDRPRLFAGMDDNHALPDEQAPRILSALESSRSGILRPKARGNAPASAIRTQLPGSAASRWPLWLLMLAGAACAGLGLWLGMRAPASSHPPRQIDTAQIDTARIRTDNTAHRSDSTATPAPAPATAPPLALQLAPLAALIESEGSRPAASPPTASPQPGKDHSPLAALTPTDTTQLPKGTPHKSKAPATPALATGKPPKAKPADTRLAAKAAASPPPTSASKARALGKKASEDDVALLEAMFAHTGARKAPRSAVQELEHRCGPLSGAEARTCRTRVCKQFPDARVCL